MAQAIGHSCEKNPTLFCRELNGSSPFYIFRVFPTFVMKATCRLICSQYTTMAPLSFSFHLFTRDTKGVLSRDRGVAYIRPIDENAAVA